MPDALARLRERRGLAVAAQLPPGRSCAGCDVCCTAPGIAVREFTKPPGEPCRHLAGEAGHSCGIYERRPRLCRLFYCLWRAWEHAIPEWMAPAKAGFVLTVNDMTRWPTVVTVHPMPDRPRAWETLWHQTAFSHLAEQWNCLVAIGQAPGTSHIFCPNGTRISLDDYSPEDRAKLVFENGFIGAPEYVFGPDRRPLAERWQEVGFSWGIHPPKAADEI